MMDRAGLLDRIRAFRPPMTQGNETDAGRQVDTGGTSGGGTKVDPSFGRSGLYDGYDPTTRFASNGVTMNPARLVQRINPLRPSHGGSKKEYE